MPATRRPPTVIVVGLKRRNGLDGCVADDDPRFRGSSAMDAQALISGHMTNDASSSSSGCLVAYSLGRSFLYLFCLLRRCGEVPAEKGRRFIVGVLSGELECMKGHVGRTVASCHRHVVGLS